MNLRRWINPRLGHGTVNFKVRAQGCAQMCKQAQGTDPLRVVVGNVSKRVKMEGITTWNIFLAGFFNQTLSLYLFDRSENGFLRDVIYKDPLVIIFR